MNRPEAGQPAAAPLIFTIGHSTRTLEVFVALLQAYDIGLLVDIRSLPGSKRLPWFDKETLGPALEAEGIDYRHLKSLGGLRPAKAVSPNMGWRNKSFRGFADYMQTESFEGGLTELMTLAPTQQTAIMCAEAVPWRCHRSLVGDALLVRGYRVMDIFSEKKASPHVLTPFARVSGERITYPPPERGDS